ASGFSPTVSFTGSGVQTIGLLVTDDRGGTATASATVSVANVGPTATLTGPTSTSEGTTITLSAAGSTDPGGDIVSVTWDLDGDGLYDDASGTTASFTPA